MTSVTVTGTSDRSSRLPLISSLPVPGPPRRILVPTSPFLSAHFSPHRRTGCPTVLATRSHACTHARSHARTLARSHARTHGKYLPIPQVDLEGAIKAGGNMHEAMAGVDHAKALEEVRPPARPPAHPPAHHPPGSSCGAESEASLSVLMPLRHRSTAPPGVHRLRPEGPGHRRAHRQCQLEARPPLPVWWGLAERPPP